MKILVVVGTRPEAIKMAPVIRALRNRPDHFDTRVCLTGQHRGLLDQVISLFDIAVDYDLDVMRPGQTLFQSTSDVLLGMERVLEACGPDLVLVHGDTTTSFASALAAFYRQIPVGHVEAGLRTTDTSRPFPEEMNRRLADRLCTYHYAATAEGRAHLLREQFDPSNILVTGNTVIDALLDVAGRPFTFSDATLADLGRERRLVLLTAHRRESFGAPFEGICQAIQALVTAYPDVEVAYPVHPNPQIQHAAHGQLAGLDRVHLIPPLDYLPFVHLMKKSTLILTDSGGIQEEAPSLGKPVLVLRDLTERPEAVAAGTALLVGTEWEGIVAGARRILDHPDIYQRMADQTNPFGDGRASERIATHLAQLNLGCAAAPGHVTVS